MSKFEMPDFLQEVQQKPFRKEPDCNKCFWLKINEVDYEQVYNKTTFTEHERLLYGKRLFQSINHNTHIFPCDECIADNKKI